MVMQVFFRYLKKVIMVAFMVYAFNMVAINFNTIIPINFWTIGFITFFDIPGLIIILIIKTLGV